MAILCDRDQVSREVLRGLRQIFFQSTSTHFLARVDFQPTKEPVKNECHIKDATLHYANAFDWPESKRKF